MELQAASHEQLAAHTYPSTQLTLDPDELDESGAEEAPTECDCQPGEPGFAGFAGPKVASTTWSCDLHLSAVTQTNTRL